MSLGEENHESELTLSSHHNKKTYYQYDITADGNLDHLVEREFFGFLHYKVIPSPFHTIRFREELLCATHTRSGEFCLTSLRAEYLYKLREFFSGDLSVLLIYVFNHVLIAIWNCKYIYIFYFAL